jgi:putative multicomponent Na+:H+ antiporter subunit B
MTAEYLRTAFLFPFELLLPILGLLLIQSESPINSLIYRSFLGSIAALIYALVGAPDVALTEVMVGTLLSSLIYIVTIRSCYTVVVIVNRHSPPSQPTKNNLRLIFNELHLKIVFQEEDFTDSLEHNFQFLASSKLSGSPHALLHESTFYAEVKTLLDDISQTSKYRTLQDSVFLKQVLL